MNFMQKEKSINIKLYLWISIISVFTITLLINLIAQLFPIRFDFSEGKRYSIGESTKALLGSLKRDITIYGLFDDGKADRDYLEIRELLKAYESKSGGHIHIEYIDPDRDTGIIARLDPEGVIGLRKNDFYVKGGNRGKKLSYQELFQMEYDQKTATWFNTGSGAERAFTGAIGIIGAEQANTVYLISDTPEAYGTFFKELQKAGRTVKAFKPDGKEIPGDAAALLFLAPDKDLTEDVLTMLSEYLDMGGRLGVFFDTAENGTDFSRWNKLLSEYSMEIENSSLVGTEPESHLSEDNKALLLDVQVSDVVPLEFYGLLLPGARSLRMINGGQAKVTVLAQTGDGTVDSNGVRGARDVVAASERSGAKLLLSGCARFLHDETKKAYAPYFVTGLYFAKSTLDWLVEKDSGSAVEIKNLDKGELQIPRYKADYIGFMTVIALPLVIFGRGFIIWRRRRYL